MKKNLLGVVIFVASLSCSVVFASPAKKSAHTTCTLEMIGKVLAIMVGQGQKPLISYEASGSALSSLKNLNSKYCSGSKITVANNSQGLTQVTGSHFTSYQCWAKNNLVTCAILTSNDQVA